MGCVVVIVWQWLQWWGGIGSGDGLEHVVKSKGQGLGCNSVNSDGSSGSGCKGWVRLVLVVKIWQLWGESASGNG